MGNAGIVAYCYPSEKFNIFLHLIITSNIRLFLCLWNCGRSTEEV